MEKPQQQQDHPDPDQNSQQQQQQPQQPQRPQLQNVSSGGRPKPPLVSTHSPTQNVCFPNFFCDPRMKF